MSCQSVSSKLLFNALLARNHLNALILHMDGVKANASVLSTGKMLHCSRQTDISSSMPAKQAISPPTKTTGESRHQTKMDHPLMAFPVSNIHLGRNFPDKWENTPPSPLFSTLSANTPNLYPAQRSDFQDTKPSLFSPSDLSAPLPHGVKCGALLPSPAAQQQTHLHFWSLGSPDGNLQSWWLQVRSDQGTLLGPLPATTKAALPTEPFGEIASSITATPCNPFFLLPGRRFETEFLTLTPNCGCSCRDHQQSLQRVNQDLAGAENIA